MSQPYLWASASALGLVALIYTACSGVSSQEPTRAPPSPVALAGRPSLTSQTVQGVAVHISGSGAGSEAKVVYIGPREMKAVALTFDTGVQAGRVPEILHILKDHGKLATFGITGEWAATNPDLLKRIVEEGHAVINHSWSHRSFTGEDTETEPLTVDQMRDELKRTEEKIQEIAEVSPKPYFRPPYGDYDKLVNQVVREAGYDYNVLWLIDSLGWDGRSAKTIVSVTLANAFNGAIFLYHTDNPRDAAALEEIIEGLDERGMRMVTIPQLLGQEPPPDATPTPMPEPTEVSPSLPPVDAVSAPTASQPAGPGPTPTPAPIPTSTPTPTPTPIVITPEPSVTPTPTTTPVPYVTLASDDFEWFGPYDGTAGDGGVGWATDWLPPSRVIGEGQGHSGSFYLNMGATGTALRWINLDPEYTSGEVRLQLWTRFDGLEDDDRALIRVGDDGLNWTLYSLSFEGTEPGVWYLYEIVIPLSHESKQVYVTFEAEMDAEDDLWHIDDVQILTAVP